MKLPAAIFLAGFGVLGSIRAADQDVAGDMGEGGLEELIRGLRDDRFQVRENASRELWSQGSSALRALEEAARSEHPEQAFRARDLIRKIQLHITPDTDPTIVGLVERYLKASLIEKTAILGKLKGKRAWRQMLKLYADEDQGIERAKLRPVLAGVAVRAAREQLLRNDPASAREFLELAPADSEHLLALAEFHRSQGSLGAELERAKAAKNRKSVTWQLALLRSAGDAVAARDAAQYLGDDQVAAAMAVLAGDPVPWLKGRPSPAEIQPLMVAYSSVAAKRWTWEKVRAADIEPLTQGLREPAARGMAMSALYLLGEDRLADAALVEMAPLVAFGYFEALERIPEALAAMGLDPKKPDYAEWVRERIRKLASEEIDEQQEPSSHSVELVTLANFLERRGLLDEAVRAFGEPLAELAVSDNNLFLDFIGSLFSRTTLRDAPLLAMKVGSSWAGDDGERWEELVAAAFGSDDETMVWWEWLPELDPRAGHAERFEAMAALHGSGFDPEGLREKWMGLAWKAVDAAPEDQRVSLAVRICTLAGITGDVRSSLKAWDMMPEGARREIFWGQQLVHLTAADRWDEVAGLLLSRLEMVTKGKLEPGPEMHAYAAAALRRAGREEEAAGHDAWADKLSLGDAGIARRIGDAYSFGGDQERAAVWWKRSVFLANPGSPDFAQSMKLHSDALLEAGDWAKAASTAELMAHLYASSDFDANPLALLRQRLQADTARALANLKSRPADSLTLLEGGHRMLVSDGSLADFFFPAIRKAGLTTEHNRWFSESWERIEAVVRQYPKSDNTRNTLAWFGSRAMRKLDACEEHLRKALELNPMQAAYLDTMAEVQFAKGNRAKALEWSKLAVMVSPEDAQLRRQHDRFKSGPLPE